MDKEIIIDYIQNNRIKIIKNSVIGAILFFIIIFVTGLFNYNLGYDNIIHNNNTLFILSLAAISSLTSFIISRTIKDKIKMIVSVFLIATIFYRIVIGNVNINIIDLIIINLNVSWFFIWSKLLFIIIYQKIFKK